MIKTLAIVLYLWSFGIIGLSLSRFENRVPLKPVLRAGPWAWAVLTITLLHMNRLNKTDSFIFVSLVCSLFPENLHSELILSSVQLVLCLVAAVERLPVHHHSTEYIFWSFWIIGLILSV